MGFLGICRVFSEISWVLSGIAGFSQDFVGFSWRFCRVFFELCGVFSGFCCFSLGLGGFLWAFCGVWGGGLLGFHWKFCWISSSTFGRSTLDNLRILLNQFIHCLKAIFDDSHY